MELLFEFLGEIFFEGIIEIIKNKKISKWIRYPLFLLISAFYFMIVVLIGILSFRNFTTNQILGVFLILISLFLLVLYFIFVRKIVKE